MITVDLLIGNTMQIISQSSDMSYESIVRRNTHCETEFLLSHAWCSEHTTGSLITSGLWHNIETKCPFRAYHVWSEGSWREDDYLVLLTIRISSVVQVSLKDTLFLWNALI